MSDGRNDRNGDDREPDEGPVTELSGFSLDPDPDLPGRVQRGIERRILVADSLEFSLEVLASTLWSHLKSLLESLPGGGRDRKVDPDE